MQNSAGNNPTRSSAIRVRVSPQLLAYSLWLIESRYQHFTPRVSDITVAVVHKQVPASVPREQSRSSTLITNGGVESTFSREEISLMEQDHQQLVRRCH